MVICRSFLKYLYDNSYKLAKPREEYWDRMSETNMPLLILLMEAAQNGMI
jgi:hypothetical protein